jgi:ATP-binding cassette subfamily C protein
MLTAVKSSLAFMTPKERHRWYLLTGLRSILSLFDLIAILAIGFVVTSTAIFLTSGSDPSRILEFAGLQIPAVNAQTLPWVSASVLAMFILKALFSVILTRKAAFFVARVEARSARTIAEISFGGDLGDARKRSREEIMYAIQSGSPHAFNTLLNSVNVFLTESMLFIVICIGFLFVDPWATLAAVAYFGLIAFIMQYFVGSLMTKAGSIAAEGAVEANKAISDLLSVFRELLVLGKRKKYIDGIYRARVAAAESAATQYYLSGMPRYIIEAALLVGVALFVLAQALAGDIVKSAATIGVFLSGGFRLTAALLPLQNSLLTINGVLPSARTAHEILDRVKNRQGVQSEGSLGNSYRAIPTQTKSGQPPVAVGVRFASVSFTYPGTLVSTLKGASFEIEPGTQVALMGPSGSGKSTIADLLCGVLSPSSGSISRYAQEAGHSSPREMGSVSYVPQQPGLVSGTILDNVALAENSANIDRDHAIEAIRLAHLGELIKELPLGLDTPLGKLKDGLSGGQIQRLGLARALYTKPGLLVMDEATSALDAQSEAEIQRALEDMRGKVTVDLIARNPSIDRIIDLFKVEKN